MKNISKQGNFDPNRQEIRVWLMRGPDDPPLRSQEYQQQLRAFLESAESQDLKVSFGIELIEAAADPTGASPTIYSGLFTLAGTAGSLGTFALGAFVTWLKGHNGRKVKLKVGNIQMEARTVDEIEKLLKLAMKGRPKTKPKKPRKTKPKRRSKRTKPSH